MSRRKLASLTRKDLGSVIQFRNNNGRHVEGVLRAFTHGLFSRPGVVDEPLVMVTIAPLRRNSNVVLPIGSEASWADPETAMALSTIPATEGERR